MWDLVKRRAEDEGKTYTQVVIDALKKHLRDDPYAR